jgi:hypothetical protein
MFRLHRLLAVYAVAIPLALILGYLVATPDMTSISVVTLVFFVLALPIFLQWSHPLLIFCWNSAFVFGFLPGQPQAWFILAIIAFGISTVNRIMGVKTFLRAPELLKPLLFLVVVVVVTAKVRGGLGLRILGNDSFGGKHYLDILVAIMGYFALTACPIPIHKSDRMVKWFFLSGTSNALGNVIYMLGPSAYFLYYIISSNNLGGQMVSEWRESEAVRLTGMGPAAIFLLCFILARWGLRGVLEWNKPWRFLLLMATFAMEMFSGFRSVLALLLVILLVQFIIEGLWKTSLLPVAVLLLGLCVAPAVLFANKMPSSVQRALSFLPVDVDPAIRENAGNTGTWRFEMWKALLPEIPKYLLVGKGYSLNPQDVAIASIETRLGEAQDYDIAIATGAYHNGPISILMAFGLFGMIAFLWVLKAGVNVLQSNRRYGDPRLKRVNDFLFGYFLVEIFMFFIVYGAFDAQLYQFLGLLGFSVALNGGVCRKPALAPQTELSSPLTAPAAVA